ncbi:SRPBCC family protein [Pelagicoccus mobilis]|uniref:SRPBCC family protein n=1 Tax=Pelagicoccus mobilis TaxID=415221 RepID=A0A934S102_9BACT|nr:SRPBCC family protein [Pelagicoccus mobilis]MBK1877464.1 SRPBCC family protein [Pelagicoccus mobilis]
MNSKRLNAKSIVKRLCLSCLLLMTVSTFTSQHAFAGKAKSVKKDSHVQTSHEFQLPASAVWKLISGFNTLPKYHAAVPESHLSEDGSIRYLTISEDAGGGVVVERLMEFDHEDMNFSYKIIGLIESPLPVENYQAWVNLESTGANSCKLYWQSTFDIPEGGTKKESEDIIEAIYKGCYDGIIRVLVQDS